MTKMTPPNAPIMLANPINLQSILGYLLCVLEKGIDIDVFCFIEINVPDTHFFLQDAFNRSKKFSDGKTFVPIQTNVNCVFMPE